MRSVFLIRIRFCRLKYCKDISQILVAFYGKIVITTLQRRCVRYIFHCFHPCLVFELGTYPYRFAANALISANFAEQSRTIAFVKNFSTIGFLFTILPIISNFFIDPARLKHNILITFVFFSYFGNVQNDWVELDLILLCLHVVILTQKVAELELRYRSKLRNMGTNSQVKHSIFMAQICPKVCNLII